jgi:hypothetical protein
MKFDRDFLTSPTGQVVLVAAVLLLGVLVVRGQRKPQAPALPVAKPVPAALLPQTLVREGARFTPPPAATEVVAPGKPSEVQEPAKLPPELPLGLFTAPPEAPKPPAALTAPYGRMIACQTVVALESNRIETPIIGLVTEDLWHNGRRIVPAGTEVHGRAALDRTRERIGALPQWRIVWRTSDADNGTEVTVDGLVLDREFDAATGRWGEHDGSAGLRGQIVKSDDERELKLFAATFLTTATAALQDNRLTSGLLGEASVPAASARNAMLSGTGAILREYAQSMREAIARDGFYLRVPAGKPFYLYVTQTIDRSQAARATPFAQAAPH